MASAPHREGEAERPHLREAKPSAPHLARAARPRTRARRSRATTMKLLMQHVQDEPVPPSSRTELAIPRAIDDLVLACLRKDPTARPRDAEDLQHRAASACRGLEPWDRALAKEWWKAHLPQRTMPPAIASCLTT